MFTSECMQEHILYDKIYQYLWMKSETSSPPAVLIPDTIIITRSMPIYWYYTDKETGEIRKKMRKNVSKDNIKTTWLSKVGKSGVVGYLLHFIENLDLYNVPDKPKVGSQIYIMYFDRETFTHFMDSPVDLPFGILQRFVEPADERNSQIQALWSKSITLFTKRACAKPFNIKSMNIYERYCTFDGPEYLSEATQVKDFQSQRIQEQIDKMIHHLDAISFGKLNIKQGTFYFKVDKEAKCWFLYCGNIKFEDDKRYHNIPKEIYYQQQIKIPKNVDTLMSVYSSRPLQLQKDSKCIRCNKLDKVGNFKEIPYSYMVDFTDKHIKVEDWPPEIRKNASQVKLSSGHSEQPAYINTITQVPIALQKIHEKLNPTNYVQLRQSHTFRNKVVNVCMECYFELVTYQEKQAYDVVVSKLSPVTANQISTKSCKYIPRSPTAHVKTRKLRDLIKPTSVESLKSPQHKVRPIEMYINARLSEYKQLSSYQYSIQQPSTAEHNTRKNKHKSVFNEIYTVNRIKGIREQQTQSVQTKLNINAETNDKIY